MSLYFGDICHFFIRFKWVLGILSIDTSQSLIYTISMTVFTYVIIYHVFPKNDYVILVN